MRRRRKISAERQLDIARAVVLGLKLDDIAAIGGVSQTTAITYRKHILVRIEAKGLPMPTCACGRAVNHMGPCSGRREDLSEPGPFTDEQLEELLGHSDNGARPQPKPAPAPEPPAAEEAAPEPEESSEAKFARQIGRSVGWGESEASIRKRLGISRLDLEHAKREHIEAYNAGVEEGRVRLVRAQNAQEEPARAAPAEPAQRAEKRQRLKPGTTRREPAKPAQRPPDPIGSDPPAPATSSFAASDEVEKQEVGPGASDLERRVAARLDEAFDAFLQLAGHGVHDIDEFHQAIHRAQAVLGLRIARRVDPEMWRQT